MKKMRKGLVFFLSVALATLISSFKPAFKLDYGPWKSMSCYKGLEFCTKHDSNGSTHLWHVKFRNNYRTTVNFAFAIKEGSATSARTLDRIAIKAGEIFETYQYLDEAVNVKVFADKMRFGDKDYGEYAPCDKP